MQSRARKGGGGRRWYRHPQHPEGRQQKTESCRSENRGTAPFLPILPSITPILSAVLAPAQTQHSGDPREAH
ncbi:unnamed protein product [Staurois parvus]|uniref:Uncharacterized protein n=1 Tax=Staurois parvus TaxID=386267 RepID=A0ABN9EDM7_9NEOB|nr:unnamed protein product [Staurois parvus]